MSKSLTFQSLKDSPSSIEAERAVLGGILIDNESWIRLLVYCKLMIFIMN